MEELLEIKELLRHGEVEHALYLVEELEEMGKKSIVRNVRSYAKVLLLYLIKQEVEQRTTKSWEASIRNAVREIKDINTRPQGRGFYLNDEELNEAITSAIDSAIDVAAIECCEGIYDSQEIRDRIDDFELIEKAYQLIK